MLVPSAVVEVDVIVVLNVVDEVLVPSAVVEVDEIVDATVLVDVLELVVLDVDVV